MISCFIFWDTCTKLNGKKTENTNRFYENRFTVSKKCFLKPLFTSQFVFYNYQLLKNTFP